MKVCSLIKSKMLYISIPVHENVQVVLSQCRNIVFYTEAVVILHASNQHFQTKIRESVLKQHLESRIWVNTKSIKTAWGNIFAAHIENLRFLKNTGLLLDSDRIAFHASNDMFIKKGVESYIKTTTRSIYTPRIYEREAYWWPANKAREDEVLCNAMEAQFGKNWLLVGGQLEGSVYTWKILEKLIIWYDKFLGTQPDTGCYPREEIIFPSFAFNLGDVPEKEVYLYSEVHKYDSIVYKYFRKIDNFKIIPSALRYLMKKIVSAGLRRLSFLYKLKLEDVKHGRYARVCVYDKACTWYANGSDMPIYAIKRVPRSINNDIRKYLTPN